MANAFRPCIAVANMEKHVLPILEHCSEEQELGRKQEFITYELHWGYYMCICVYICVCIETEKRGYGHLGLRPGPP